MKVNVCLSIDAETWQKTTELFSKSGAKNVSNYVQEILDRNVEQAKALAILYGDT